MSTHRAATTFHIFSFSVQKRRSDSSTVLPAFRTPAADVRVSTTSHFTVRKAKAADDGRTGWVSTEQERREGGREGKRGF